MSKIADDSRVLLCHTGSCCASVIPVGNGGMRIEDADEPERGGITLTPEEVAALKRAVRDGRI